MSASRNKRTQDDLEHENETPLSSPFKSVFEESIKLLFDGYADGESVEMKKRREERFATFYDKHVIVNGSVPKSKWNMSSKCGAMLPVEMKYTIGIKINGYQNEKIHDYLEIKKSTLGTDEETGDVKNPDIWRFSGFGIFANRDFQKGEYIGPYLGEIKENGRNTLNSSYSMNRPDGKILDANGGFWNKWYFGMHWMNDARESKEHCFKNNVDVDAHLRFYAKRDIKKGEELFVSYGKAYWNRVAKTLK